MAEIALGWLGWSEQQALDADMNAILIGHAGKLGLLETAGFIERVKATEKPTKTLTPDVFDKLF